MLLESASRREKLGKIASEIAEEIIVSEKLRGEVQEILDRYYESDLFQVEFAEKLQDHDYNYV